MYEDKTLVCKDCGAEFVFTAGEQEFYAEKGFQNEPTRCKACRQARKASRAAGAPRQMFDAVCAECGKPRCSTLYARNAESPPRFLSSLRKTALYTAASASLPVADKKERTQNTRQAEMLSGCF